MRRVPGHDDAEAGLDAPQRSPANAQRLPTTRATGETGESGVAVLCMSLHTHKTKRTVSRVTVAVASDRC